jgi:tetraacyldisaccharide 4'-kinase
VTTLPSFESPLPSWLARSPLATLPAGAYGIAVRKRNQRYDSGRKKISHVDRPVVSVGGIRAGGTGKTPSVMFLIEQLSRMHFQTAVLSRGYRRKTNGRRIVTPSDGKVPWEEIGDEPAMIRTAYPDTCLGIGADRYQCAKQLEYHLGKRSVFLLDDGFQHRRFHRNVDIVCIHESIFSDRLLPQGYLREPLSALARADVLFLTGSESQLSVMRELSVKLAIVFPKAEQFILLQKVAGWVHMESGEISDTIPCRHPAAFCGIARPERFFSFLPSIGVQPSKNIAFSDHYRYRECDILSLRELYSQGLVTTEKDIVRLKGVPSVPVEKVWYLKIRLDFAENESFDRFSHYIKPKLDIFFPGATCL